MNFFDKGKCLLMFLKVEYSPATPRVVLDAPPVPRGSTQGRGIKKQLLQRLSILLVQVQTGNTPENLLNQIKQIFYSVYWTKQVSKKV